MSRKQRAAVPEAPVAENKPKGGKRQKLERKPSRGDRYPYEAKVCAKVEKLGAEGKSAPEIRRELGISASAWRSWVKKFPEFADAVEQAADQAEAWWIDMGRKGMMLGTNFSAQTFIYLTKNIFPARFRDRQDHQITGANDGPIVQELRAPDLASIADPREALKQFQAFRSSLALAATATAETKH
jgi:hypothetical protein